MKKLALVLAITAAPFAAPLAQAADDDAIKIYGRVNVALDAVDDGKDYSELNLSSRSSRLGFKAESKQEGYTAFVQIEQEINFASGADGQKSLSSRDTFVGLKGDRWGAVKIGQFDTPFKAARGAANLFGDQVGDMRALTRVGRFDERAPNTLQYSTPSFNGLQVNLAYALHEGDKNAADATDPSKSKKDAGISISATYKVGALDTALAYETWEEDHSRGERNGIRLAAAYKIGAAKVVGLYQTTSHETDKKAEADVYGLGGEYALTSATALRAMYIARSADADDSDSNMLAVGVEHKLDSKLRVHMNYAMLGNDKATNYAPWNESRNSSIANGVPDETASALSVGLRYDF